METEQIKVTPPEGYEIDMENSTPEVIILKKKTNITYNDVARHLFIGEKVYYIGYGGGLGCTTMFGTKNCFTDPNNALTKKQLHRVLALNQLFNIAIFYNGDWMPCEGNRAYFIYFYDRIKEYCVDYTLSRTNGLPVFKNEADAQAVIDNPNFRPILDAIYKNY